MAAAAAETLPVAAVTVRNLNEESEFFVEISLVKISGLWHDRAHGTKWLYKVVQLNFTPEIEAFYMLSNNIFLKQKK